MVLVDSSVWIDHFAGRGTPQTEWLDRAAGRRALSKFPVLFMVGEAVALRSARNYRALRARGITVRKTIDCLIATCCILRNVELLHSDRDFDPFEQHLGLRVVRP